MSPTRDPTMIPTRDCKMSPRRSLLVGALGLGGCGSSPEPSLFTLGAIAGPARAGAGGVVQLRRIGLAGYLDRPEVMRSAGAVQFRAATNERWAEPFEDMVGRVLAENLTQRLPGTTVFTAVASLPQDADTAVQIEVQRFEADAAGLVTLAAQVMLRRRAEAGRARSGAAATMFRVTEPAASPGTADVAAAMSRALGRLADAVADGLRGMT